MTNLLAAALFFIAQHRLISGTSLRSALVAQSGERTYGRLFRLASLLGLVWLGFAYSGARSAPSSFNSVTSTTLSYLTIGALQFAAVVLIVSGIAAPNPGTVDQEATIDRPDIVRGILRVTRHPFLSGVALFGFGHLLTARDAADWVLFGTLFS